MDLRPRDDLAGLGVDHHDDRDEPLLAEDAAVLQVGVGDLAHARAVDVDVAARHGAHHLGEAVLEVDDDAVLGVHDPLARDAGEHRDVAVGHEVPGLTVHGHGVAWPDDVVAVEQLAGTGVTGHVHARVALVHHVGTQPGQAVDHAEHGVLVARDQRRREHHRVAFADHVRNRRVQKALQIGLFAGDLVEDHLGYLGVIQEADIGFRVDFHDGVALFEDVSKLPGDAAYNAVLLVAEADPGALHARGELAAEAALLVDDNRLRAVSRSGQTRDYACGAAARDQNIHCFCSHVFCFLL